MDSSEGKKGPRLHPRRVGRLPAHQAQAEPDDHQSDQTNQHRSYF